MKKEIIILMILSVFLISACDVYNTLYIKEAQEDAVEVPDSDIMTEEEDVEEGEAEMEEEEVSIGEVEVEEEVIEVVEIDIGDILVEEEEIPEDATVLIIEETETVSLVTRAEDPDKDVLIFTFTSPLDEDGEWKTTYGDAGEYTVTVTASDGELTASKEVLIIVNRKEEAPLFDGFNPEETIIEVDETDSVIFEVDASDLNDDELSYSWKLDGVEIGEEDSIEYETTYEDSGSHTVKVSVSDGLFDSEKIWSVTVNNLNRDPVFEPVNDLEVVENKTIEIELKAFDPDNDIISFSAENLPVNSTLEENIFIFSPDFNFVIGKKEERIDIGFIADDGESQAKIEVRIDVFNKNRGPDIIAIFQKGKEDIE